MLGVLMVVTFITHSATAFYNPQTGRWPEAQQEFVHAHLLAPRAPQYLAFLADVVSKEMPEWERVRVDLGQSERARNP